ncbi:hypothetical protein ACSBR2_016767 [Camellia fascicularis]
MIHSAVSVHKMERNALGLLLESGTEAIHHVDTIWWIEQIRLRIEPGWSTTTNPPLHSLQMTSMRSIDQDHRRIRSLLPRLVTDPLPLFPSMDSLKILIWNCRWYSSMGNFFSNMGFSAATIVDLVGRSSGIWLIWDTDQVNVRASSVSNQYMQGTIHKEDYEEWVLNAVYASPNPSLREAL